MTKQKNSLEQALRELSDIVKWFEDQQEVDVEEGLKKARRAAELVASSRTRLREIENEFEEVRTELERGREGEGEE